MKPTKKRAAKRERNPMISKLLDLKYRINDAYRKDGSSYENIGHKKYVTDLIEQLRFDSNNFLGKDTMIKCNELWKLYE